MADSIDQTEHVIYDDTAALGRAIRCLDNPFGRVLMPNTLGKAYYYMGRNYSMSNQIADAANCYIEADRLQIDDPIYRGRVNSCMGYICVQNNNDSLALIFYEGSNKAFKESGNDWYYAQSLLNVSQCHILEQDCKNATIRVYDILGRLQMEIISDTNLPSGEHSFSTNLNKLNNGVYLLVTQIDNKNSINKFAKF